MSNYAATVVQIDNISKHSGADRLQITNLFQNNVIVGLDTKVGDVGVFFPLESQLGLEFAQANDLMRRKDENGKVLGGLFDQNRRVRAQTLRGEKSMGFFCPLSYLEKAGVDVSDIKVGDTFETIQGVEISKKYVIPTRQKADTSKKGKKAKKEKSRLIPEHWQFHFDTSHLGRNVHNITPETLVSISHKWHGSSAIVGYKKVLRDLPWYEKALKFVGVKVQETEYDYIASSRKVIKNLAGKQNKNQGYYKEDVWTHAGQQFKGKLLKGETVYMELVGFTPDGSAIQKGYDYGCDAGQYKIQIYRITQTNDDGVVTELPWHQVKHRAIEMGFDTVPEIYYGYAKHFIPSYEGTQEEIDNFGQTFYDYLSEFYVYDQDCQFCKNKVPAEGVVVRVENGSGIVNYKYKSFRFLGHETAMLDKGEADIESDESQGDADENHDA